MTSRRFSFHDTISLKNLVYYVVSDSIFDSFLQGYH